MKEGKVKFFNTTKGFGFITPDDGTADVFVHESGLSSKIKDNDRVQFETERGKKGINAVRVQVIK
jgi:CspA family cold shock protein